MFDNIFKKADKIYSPVSGQCLDITEVADKMFSSKMLGDGVAVLPVDELICSPIDGKLVMIAETNHAFGVESKTGLELLIHIGIDTVELNGTGFEKLANVGEKVKQGAPIIQIHKNEVPEGVDLTTMIVITKGNLNQGSKPNLNHLVAKGDVILS